MTLVMSANQKVRTAVVFAIPSMGLGGSERVVLNLLRWLDRDSFQLHLAVLDTTGKRMSDLPADVEVHPLRASRARYAAPALASIIRRTRARILFSTSAHLNTAAVLAKVMGVDQGVRILTREGADIVPLLNLGRPSGSALSVRLRLAIYRKVYQRSDRVICQSDAMRRSMIRDFALDPERVVRVYNPVDIEEIRRESKFMESTFHSSELRLVAVSRFSREKGIDLLLSAFRKVLQKLPQARLSLVGSGPEEGSLRQQVSALAMEDSVEFVGAQRNPYPYMRRAHLLVLPSRCEAFPNVVLESIALGVAVVASPCSDALNEIKECSSILRIAQSGEPGSLASAIEKALSSPPPSTPAKVSERFVERFDAKSVASECEKLFRSVICLPSESLQLSSSAA